MSQLISETPTTKPDFLSRPLSVVWALDWEKTIYLLFALLALVTRLWALGDRVMSHDESLHTQFSWQHFRGDGYSHTPLMHGPFLFHITPLFYWLFGASDFSSRLPVALFGVVLATAFPYLLRPWLGKVGALFTSFFLLISPFITYYSRYIRHDIYVIVWAMVIFVATWYYLRTRKETMLWWFAGGLALMYSTKEVSFIYTAIFGSFLVIRLALRIFLGPWLRHSWTRITRPLIVAALALVLTAGAFAAMQLSERVTPEAAPTATASEDQGFAADPEEQAPVSSEPAASGRERVLRLLQVAGLITFGLAIFFAVKQFRPHIDELPEFDLIVLYSTLLLPALSPFMVVVAGFNPIDYSMNVCELAGQESMSMLELFIARLTNPTCLSVFFASPLVRTGFFVVLTLGLAAAAGLWWNQRRWLIAAAIFHTIFLVLHTSVFTNPGGWGTGMVGALGYWLEQQEVQRGSQPWFYYLFVVPFYEFLPIIFSFLAIRLWARGQRLNRILGYWISLLLASTFAYSFGNWLINREAVLSGGESSSLVAIIVAVLVLLIGAVYWQLVHQKRLKREYDLGRSWRGLVQVEELVGFVPMLVWWLMGVWLAYSYAGEKMPWLTTHFVIPMALLGGWYFNEKFLGFSLREMTSRWALLSLLLTVVFVVTAFFTVRPLIIGHVALGDQSRSNLIALGSLLGTLLLAALAFWALREVGRRLAPPVRRRTWLLGAFALLSLLTMRFTYLASWPNADYATEFMVYAHAGPAVKDVVMDRVETLSQRMHGDKSIRVAWGDDGTWPMQWYLRDYPNRLYAGKTPSANISDYPIVIAGHRDMNAFENLLSDRDYLKEDYIFLWWPMEEYRKFSWNGLFGLSDVRNAEGSSATGRGLQSAEVRRALWDIFFYRNYERYSELFGNVYSDDQWRLRAELRLYIRRDALANLWDYGIEAARIEPPVDPYAEGELQLTPNLVIGTGGTGEGELFAPRNLAVGPDGNLYVLDSGNHRVVVFDQNGAVLRSWGNFGVAPGQFNEPWGIVVDDEAVYVADTWNHRVQTFRLDGEFVASVGQSGTVAELGSESGGYFFGPRSLALVGEDQFLVTDTGNHRLQLYDRNGNFVRTIGQLGANPGQFNEPVGLASADGRIYLADTWNARIQRFTGGFFAELDWSIDGWQGDSTENKPYLAVDSRGNVYATDPENSRVLIFSSDGQYLGRFGRPGATTDALGLPNGIAIDAEDNVYLADARNSRILRFGADDFAELGPSPGGDLDAGMQDEPADSPFFEEEAPEQPPEELAPSPTPPDNGE